MVINELDLTGKENLRDSVVFKRQLGAREAPVKVSNLEQRLSHEKDEIIKITHFSL
mgnify:FL=1|jgi:hypothetical protein